MPRRLPDRLRHALRFAVATLVCVYVAGVVWELVDVYLLGPADAAGTAWSIFAFNEHRWRIVAAVVGGVVFLIKLGDLTADPPSWGFAWIAGVWLALAAIVVAVAIEERLPTLAVGAALLAIVGWYLLRRRLPGRPGAARPASAAPPMEPATGERDLR